ncbi:hypothetical protein [uncultured Shimia sp.]|uniref:hypothetical protein n=1 Tax=uncultured Shimia sp. TaxID=573152 RepID=UPI002616C113|nr:hypothetical protein [uncultured Shimia sp.]
MSQTSSHNTSEIQNHTVPDSPAFVMRRLLGTIMQRFANARDPEFVKKDTQGYDLVEDSIDYVDVTDDDPAPKKVYLGTPKSESLTQAEILAAIESGIDPFASDVNGEPDRQFLHPPFTDLLVGARIADWITSTGQFESLVADDAFYVVVEADEQFRNVYEASLEAVCMLSAQLFLAQRDDFDGFEICVKDCDWQRLQSSRKSTLKEPGWRYKRYGFEKSVRAALVENVPVVAVVKTSNDIPEDLRVFQPVELELPALSREMLVEILRVTHTSTGHLAE